MTDDEAHEEHEVMVHLSTGVWLHGIKVIDKEKRVHFNPLRLVLDLAGGYEKIYKAESADER